MQYLEWCLFSTVEYTIHIFLIDERITIREKLRHSANLHYFPVLDITLVAFDEVGFNGNLRFGILKTVGFY